MSADDWPRVAPRLDYEVNEDTHLRRASNERQDLDFCSAMVQAIIARKESPPMIGIDRRPCTVNPRLVGVSRTRSYGNSSAASCAESGAPSPA